MANHVLELGRNDELTALLSEYQACQASASSLEQTIWQTSAILGLGSLGAIITLAATEPPFAIIAIVALLSVATSWLWWATAKRWWTVEHIKFARMRDIEERLGVVRQNHYVKYLDDLHDTLRREPKPVAVQRRLEIRDTVAAHNGLDELTVLRLDLLHHNRAGPIDILKWLRWIIVAAWAAYAMSSVSIPRLIVFPIWWPIIHLFVVGGA